MRNYPETTTATSILYQEDHDGAIEDTSNDEMIARALAAAENEEIASAASSATAARQSAGNGNSNGVFSYPGSRQQSHGPIFPSSYSSPFSYYPPNPPQGRIVDATLPPPSSSSPPAPAPPLPPFPFGSLVRPQQRTHMCHVPCIVGHNDQVCVEMMVDTGAESSVISMELARQLQLQQLIDRREQGIASGVGKARILGKIRQVIVTFGEHVEFPMDFIVLDIPNIKLFLLGMDQMRKYQCIIDLSRNVMIFGGIGGVEVNLLPPDQQPANMLLDNRLLNGEACVIS